MYIYVCVYLGFGPVGRTIHLGFGPVGRTVHLGFGPVGRKVCWKVCRKVCRKVCWKVGAQGEAALAEAHTPPSPDSSPGGEQL